jgi:hypothetical protein
MNTSYMCLIYLDVTKLLLFLLLYEYKGLFLDEKSNNLVNMDGCAILKLHHSRKNSSKFKRMVTSCKNDKI